MQITHLATPAVSETQPEFPPGFEAYNKANMQEQAKEYSDIESYLDIEEVRTKNRDIINEMLGFTNEEIAEGDDIVVPSKIITEAELVTQTSEISKFLSESKATATIPEETQQENVKMKCSYLEDVLVRNWRKPERIKPFDKVEHWNLTGLTGAQTVEYYYMLKNARKVDKDCIQRIKLSTFGMFLLRNIRQCGILFHRSKRRWTRAYILRS